MDGATLVSERRTAMTVDALGIASDAQEIPTPTDGSKPVGWWLAERSRFTSRATDDAQAETTREGTTALAVTAERVVGIVSPNDGSTSAVWFSWGLPSLDIQTAGSQGFLKKRPMSITLALNGASVELSAVSRLWRNSGRYQTGQEGSLLKALTE